MKELTKTHLINGDFSTARRDLCLFQCILVVAGCQNGPATVFVSMEQGPLVLGYFQKISVKYAGLGIWDHGHRPSSPITPHKRFKWSAIDYKIQFSCEVSIPNQVKQMFASFNLD